MHQQRSVAFSRWIPVAASAIAASSAAGCTAAGDAPAGAALSVRHVRVTQADVGALPPGERLRLDLGAARVAYHVALDPALDADRIVLVSAGGAEAPLAAEIEAIERRAAEPLATADGRLLLTGDPTVFEELDAAELSALRAQGELVKPLAAPSPNARPQSTDPCGRSGVYLESDLAGGAAALSVWSAHVALICEPICAPGATEACYGGPEVTRAVGACHAGQRACNLTGTAWGPCFGEARPESEACTSTTDIDCNGAVGCLPGHLWSKLFGDAVAQAGNRLVYDIATDAAGNLLLTGSFSRSLPVGSQTLVGGRGVDAFVIKLDPAGNPLWARSFGSDGPDIGFGIATDASGDVIVTGSFWNTVDFGAGPLVSAGGPDIFVLRLDANGTTLWSQRYGAADAQMPEVIAVGPGGEITVAGRYYGPLDFGLGPLPTSNITRTFVLRLDAGGVPLWSRGFDVEYVMWPKDLAADPSGDVVLAGWTQGWVDLGGGPVSGAGGEDGFVVRLASGSGATVWGRVIGGPEDDQVTGAALDGAGGLVVAGWFGGQVGLGGGATLTSAGSTDALVAKLDAGSGGVLWGKALGNASQQDASALALDAAGNIVLLGHYRGVVDLGGGLMTSFSEFAMSRFLARLDPAGSLLWSRGYAFQTYSLLHGAEEERGLAVDAAGNVFFSGVMFDSAWAVEYGGGLLDPLGNMDFVVAKYAP
ncbi:hypothetical protein WME76_24075 [Sorangium sp. So ce119]|uniref:hypothetical protein n=1 Tax=Sorangium sp. So ce119 TaxID=3133279 RepID=UPI003F6422F9